MADAIFYIKTSDTMDSWTLKVPDWLRQWRTLDFLSKQAIKVGLSFLCLILGSSATIDSYRRVIAMLPGAGCIVAFTLIVKVVHDDRHPLAWSARKWTTDLDILRQLSPQYKRGLGGDLRCTNKRGSQPIGGNKSDAPVRMTPPYQKHHAPLSIPI
jgi:hypothetical protein